VTLGEVVFSVRPWQSEFGDPAAPATLLGVPVVERLLRRDDAPGALVVLGDRRYALTGSVLVVGSGRQIAGYVRRRAVRQPSPAQDAWLRRVVSVLTQRPRP
jgi:cell volume regulation protein A